MIAFVTIIIILITAFSFYYVGYSNGKEEAKQDGIRAFVRTTTDIIAALDEAKVTPEQMTIVNKALEANAKKAYDTED